MTLLGLTTYNVLQALIIAAVVTVSVLHVARKLAPNWMYRMQAALANRLNDAARPAMVRRMGRLLQPELTSGGGCGSGCSTCASCDSNPDKGAGKDTQVKPLKFTRHI